MYARIYVTVFGVEGASFEWYTIHIIYVNHIICVSVVLLSSVLLYVNISDHQKHVTRSLHSLIAI